jgi:hypothetical protein
MKADRRFTFRLVFTLLGAGVLMPFLPVQRSQLGKTESSRPNPLLTASEEDLCLHDSSLYTSDTPDADALVQALNNIEWYPDHRSFHSVCYLHKFSEERWAQVAPDRIAVIMIAVLKRRDDLHDFGVLLPEGSYPSRAGVILIHCKSRRVLTRELFAMLDDETPVRLMGSKTATASINYQYRKKDYAYFFLCSLLQLQHVFDPDPVERDHIIASNFIELQRRAGLRKTQK